MSAQICIEALKRGNKILVCGNGGSAAQAQHFVAELVVRYKLNRRALPAIALTADSAVLTAIGNDFGYEHVFSRQIEALGQSGDVLIALTTSGQSKNILKGCEQAVSQGLHVIMLETGQTDITQEQHLRVLHALAERIEESFCE
jgi:D-sedoheptulose 7-phosphate isomerase